MADGMYVDTKYLSELLTHYYIKLALVTKNKLYKRRVGSRGIRMYYILDIKYDTHVTCAVFLLYMSAISQTSVTLLALC